MTFLFMADKNRPKINILEIFYNIHERSRNILESEQALHAKILFQDIGR